MHTDQLLNLFCPQVRQRRWQQGRLVMAGVCRRRRRWCCWGTSTRRWGGSAWWPPPSSWGFRPPGAPLQRWPPQTPSRCPACSCHLAGGWRGWVGRGAGEEGRCSGAAAAGRGQRSRGGAAAVKQHLLPQLSQLPDSPGPSRLPQLFLLPQQFNLPQLFLLLHRPHLYPQPLTVPPVAPAAPASAAPRRREGPRG